MAATPGKIDVHHHVLPEFYKDVQRSVGITGSAYTAFPDWSEDKSLQLMDEVGISSTIFSFTSPGIYFGDVSQTRALAVRFNDWLAELTARNPKRFGAFGFLPLPDVDASIKEIGRIQDELKLDGVCLLTSVDNRYIGDPMFWPVYEELNRRKIVTFIHPCYPPGVEAKGWDIPRMLIDYPFETTKVATNLIFNGVMEKLPDIPFILSHAGGTLPMLAHRISLFDKKTKQQANYPKGALHYIKQFWYDTALSGDKPPLDALFAFADPGRVLFGTDYPYISADLAVSETKGYENYAGLSGAARANVDRNNALKLFPRLA
jgi:predicted TIM-barrel fold metal-dependent hydrolase